MAGCIYLPIIRLYIIIGPLYTNPASQYFHAMLFKLVTGTVPEEIGLLSLWRHN